MPRRRFPARPPRMLPGSARQRMRTGRCRTPSGRRRRQAAAPRFRCPPRGRMPAAVAPCRRPPAAVPCRRRPPQRPRGADGRCPREPPPARRRSRAGQKRTAPVSRGQWRRSLRTEAGGAEGDAPGGTAALSPGRQQRFRLGCQQRHSSLDGGIPGTCRRVCGGANPASPRPTVAGFRPRRRLAPVQKRAVPRVPEVGTASGSRPGSPPPGPGTPEARTGGATGESYPAIAFPWCRRSQQTMLSCRTGTEVHHAARKIARLVHTTSSSGRRPAS